MRISFNNIKRTRKKFEVIQFALDNGLTVRDYFNYDNVVSKETTIRKTPSIVEILVDDAELVRVLERMLTKFNVEHYKSMNNG